jgi:hypothetical protein
MQKCPLCDKKIPEDAKFCPQCGWDLTDHELTPLQIARIQEEIQDARFRAMHWHVAIVAIVMLAAANILLGMFARDEVIPREWDFMLHIGYAVFFIGIACNFYADRYRKKKDRLKVMLRDRQSPQ